jgi:2-polyprenyl-3-methyl-5-hydroxy-6-metoxy-1,4-benzoquinol methylase
VEGALGIANHLPYASIEPGETILDVGCGAGIDPILAALTSYAPKNGLSQDVQLKPTEAGTRCV